MAQLTNTSQDINDYNPVSYYHITSKLSICNTESLKSHKLKATLSNILSKEKRATDISQYFKVRKFSFFFFF